MTSSNYIFVIGAVHIDILADFSASDDSSIDKPGDLIFGYGGTAFNVAVSLASRKKAVRLMSVLGANTLGARQIADALNNVGISSELIVQSSRLGEAAFLAFRDNGRLVSAVTSTHIEKHKLDVKLLNECIRNCQHVVADCNLSVDQLCMIATMADSRDRSAIIAGVSETKAKRLLETRTRLPANIMFELVVVNEKEVQEFGTGSLREKAARIGTQTLVVTRGDKGILIVPPTSPQIELQAQNHDYIASTSGSGDAVTAAFSEYFFLNSTIPKDNNAIFEFQDILFEHMDPVLLSRTSNFLGEIEPMDVLQGKENRVSTMIPDHPQWSSPPLNLKQLIEILWNVEVTTSVRVRFKKWAESNLQLRQGGSRNQWVFRLDLLERHNTTLYEQFIESGQ